MNRWPYRQKALVGGCVTDGVICPKPRRMGLPLHFHDSVRPQTRLIRVINQQLDVYDSKAGTVLMDSIRSKGSHGSDRSNFQVASSPPFFIGSPPSRASNPVIQDEHFGHDICNPLQPSLESMRLTSTSSHENKVYSRVTGESNPALVRIEGFNCCENCSISAVA